MTTKKMYLYPPRPVKGQDFSKEKIVTVPNQSLSLRDIIARFIRKESLPVMHEGIYNDQLGDLEKIQNEDITMRHERAASLKASIAEGKRRYEAKVAADKKAAEPPPPPPPPPPPQPGPVAS